MKKLLIGTIILFLVVALLGYSLGYRIGINHEWAKIYNTRGGYRSWTISYSHGQQWNGAEWINLWKWPSFHHCDMRPFLKNLQTTGEEWGDES